MFSKVARRCFSVRSLPQVNVQRSSEVSFFPSLEEQTKFGEFKQELKRDLFPAAYQIKATDQLGNLIAHNEKCFDYMLRDGKWTRPACFLQMYMALQGPGNRDMVTARAMGWTLEMLQASFLIADDLVDMSDTRRGRPCWHVKEGIRALNDVAILREGIDFILQKYCRSHPLYAEMLELFNWVARIAYGGQKMDLMASDAGRRGDLANFTPENYDTLRKYNNSSYTTILPYRLAAYFAGLDDAVVHEAIETIAHKIGMYFIIQDDYIDVFVDDHIKGKPGTDIANGKCSWLIVKALQVANSDQRRVLAESYGQFDQTKVDQVKEVYLQLNLEEIYRKQEKETLQEIYELINAHCSSALPAEPFINFLKLLDGRNK
ncbi:Farnesyl pyrophosphate synthase [Halotydeus destructor]|nr:Farnesyl pyrophosphate synthase [Halotydeus destructor]